MDDGGEGERLPSINEAGQSVQIGRAPTERALHWSSAWSISHKGAQSAFQLSFRRMAWQSFSATTLSPGIKSFDERYCNKAGLFAILRLKILRVASQAGKQEGVHRTCRTRPHQSRTTFRPTDSGTHAQMSMPMSTANTVLKRARNRRAEQIQIRSEHYPKRRPCD